MLKTHGRNATRYYILVVILFAFLFFTNDFGLTDVQKTAIVTAVGIDREEEEFLLTSQIAVPQASDQGQATESVQLVTRGKTVAEAFEAVNIKTGWYPKLVFCKLVLLGESATERNVFDALDFFLRDEYLTDDCQVVACKGKASELLDTSPLVDSSSSAAIAKVLSAHAERVGTVRPVNLKDFSIGYFGDAQSGLLPVLTKEKQKESSEGNQENGAERGGQGGGGQSSFSIGSGGSNGGKQEEKPIFSASETALFVGGIWRETLTAEETFAVNCAVGKLQLASYTVETDGTSATLLVKHNDAKIGLDLGKDGRGVVKIEVKMVAGVADFSKAQAPDKIRDAGDMPVGAFASAEKKLAASLSSAYEKAKGVGCDVFGLQERLVKYKRRAYLQYKDDVLRNSALSVTVKFESVR